MYTGVCPQTLIFEALGRVQHLQFLHDFQPQTPTIRPKETETIPKPKAKVGAKQPAPHKPKISPPITNRLAPSTIQNKTFKVLPRPVDPKPKVPPISKIKSENVRPAPVPKKVITVKTPVPTTKASPRPIINKEKKMDKPQRSSSQPKQMKKSPEKPKPVNTPKKKVDNHKALKPPAKQQQLLSNNPQPNTKVEIPEKEKLEPIIDLPEEQHEHHSESHIDEYEQSGISHDDNRGGEEDELGEKSDHEISADELDDINKTSADADEDEIPRSDLISMANSHDEASADELDDNNKTSANADQDDIPRSDSILMANGHNEALIESNTSSPLEEIKSQSSPHNPMTQGFVDGNPNTENPFLDETNDIDDDDDDMEIIHHDILTSNRHSPPSVEDIHPQNLPVENHLYKSTSKTSNR